jgi:hypothetical protein
MANGSKNLSSMRSRRPQGGLEDGPIPAADLQVQIGSITVIDTSAAGGDEADEFDSTLQSAAGTGLNGYTTGNHMYMHLVVDAFAAASFDVYGYSYATQKWALLRLPVGGNNDSTQWTTNLDPVTISVSATAGAYLVVPIYGVDRVAFGAGNNAQDSADLNGGTFQVTFNTF